MSPWWLASPRTGNPNNPATPTWAAYTPQNRATMLSDEPSRVLNDLNKDVIALLASFPATRPGQTRDV
jgi:carboxylesterase type B